MRDPEAAVLPRPLQEAIEKFERWTDEHLQAEQDKDTIKKPLYHYTDARGLKGIIESGQVWFTDYRNLNDPSELVHGIDIAHDVAQTLAASSDGRVSMFLEILIDMFRPAKFDAKLEFFIASFSPKRDDLAQWRAYSDDGRGFAIGFSPRLFEVVEQPAANQLSDFLGRVRYTVNTVRTRHRAALEKAAETFLDALNANADLVMDEIIENSFMQALARDAIALPLIWNCLTSKHPAYSHEREVRLAIMGTTEAVACHVKTRLRGSEIVRYIAHSMPLREPRNTVEIVIGPAAPADAERSVRTILNSLGAGANIRVKRSDIPYRAVSAR